MINAAFEHPEFTELDSEILRRANSRLWLWRLDQIPGEINGNKAFKLLPGLAEAQDRGLSGVASFGGAWSNHLHVLAAAGTIHNLKTLGFVRGDSDAPPSAMLVDAVSHGMRLHFLSRSDYRRRHDPDFLKQLQAKFPGYHWLPEGGSNLAGVRGCSVLGAALSGRLEDGDIIALPCGTGGTLAGLVSGLVAAGELDLKVVGYTALKGANFLDADIRRWLVKLGSGATAWSLEHRFHGGGYGKCNEELSAFILEFYRRHRIALDPVYNAKMMWGIYQQLAAGEFDGRRIVALHTGGLQGLRGCPGLLADMTQMGFEGLQ